MTPSEELELKILRFAEATGKADWRPTDLPTLSNEINRHDQGILIEALDDLHARELIELRQWSDQRGGWVVYPGKNPQYLRRMFEMRVTFSGRKYFERLEIESRVPARPTPTQKAAPETTERTATSQTRTETPKAFVSHATQDHPFVEKFAADLRTNGVDAWFSKWEIKPGDSIRAKIDGGLEGCEYFIIVLSKSSIGRPWVQTELDAATIRKLNGNVRKIIPVKIEDCGDLPPTLASLCWEDFSNQPYEKALKRVVDSIFEVDVRPPLGKPPKPMPPADDNDRRSTEPQKYRVPDKTTFPINMFDVDDFAKRLKGEGFDARADLYNGQGGLIVGPKGLDPIRMPPDTRAFFFPLWELNHDSNRSLVDARKFHEIFEKRPPDWLYNRPYPKDL